jgi:uncharacterized protein involved in exopolysaccharide biosynthesis
MSEAFPSAGELDGELQGGVPDFLRDPRGTLRRRWKPMLAALLIGLLATVAFTLTREPRYAATAVLMVTSQQLRQDLVRTTVEDDALQRINGMAGKVLSRDQMLPLIDKYDPYPALTDVLTRDEIADRMREDASVTNRASVGQPRREESAIVLEVRFESDRPDVAAGVANDIASGFVEESVEARTKQAKAATSFLRQQLEHAETALTEQTRLLREFNEKYQGELPSELSTNLSRLDRLQQQRQSLALQIAEANTRVATLTSQTPAASAQEGPEQRLDRLRGELAEKTSHFTDRHPEVVALREQIAKVESELGVADGAMPSRSALITAANLEVSALQAQLADTERQLAELDRRVANAPARQEELAALEQRESVLRENYVDFLRKVQEAELAENLESSQQGERVEVVERAVPPSEPERSALRYAIAGAIASFGVACFLGIALEIADPVLVSADQVVQVSGLRVLGMSPRIS